MKILVNALMEIKSIKERQKRLSEAIDYLSFCYPDLFSLLFREIKKRELESNDLYKISKWFNNSNSYVKLHGALVLVKNNNILAKEEYLRNLNRMLCQTIENGTNIDATVKICRLIEKSSHLESIYNCLKDSILRIYQLHKNKRSTNTNNPQPLNLLKDNFQLTQNNPLNIGCDQHKRQQQLALVLPSMQKPYNQNTDYCSPYFTSDYLNMVETINNDIFDLIKPRTFFNLTIVDQGMDGAVSYWLHYLKLHKYQWFFISLGYLEIESIDEDNIEEFIIRVNKYTITKGAQKKICLSTKILRDRPQKLKNLLLTLDLEITVNELCEFTVYMREILHYPIPNKNCFVGSQLQHDLVCVMEKLLYQLLEKLNMVDYLVAQSLLGSSINTFLECTLLITSNKVFTKPLVNIVLSLCESLKYKVHQMSVK